MKEREEERETPACHCQHAVPRSPNEGREGGWEWCQGQAAPDSDGKRECCVHSGGGSARACTLARTHAHTHALTLVVFSPSLCVFLLSHSFASVVVFWEECNRSSGSLNNTM